MKFGEVPIKSALGAILAHSVGLPDGRLRKGRALGQEDIQRLMDAGLTTVTVAQLEPGDAHENDAAAALAAAFVPDPEVQNLRLTEPFTGRVNLLASGPGIVMLDEDAITAVNAVHPMITIATVPPFQQLAEGGMVATIKIISYGVAKTDLERACALAKAGVRLVPPSLRSASLIVTDIDGGAGDKGWRVTADRLAAFGIGLPEPVLVPHSVAPLADALARSDSDLTLILTASATSDAEDVAPAAVRVAGGQVDRFGMPVDPGNLLFVGRLGDRAVIGLPGCARSPALNGADWVMARLICGLPVGDTEISAMGVGGLLKEILTRPHPRRTARKDRA
ncbi:MAG: molybdopterin-binding protein [Pseudomonadota bacterium]